MPDLYGPRTAAGSSAGGGGSPAGLHVNTAVLFNDSSLFGEDSNFTWNKTTRKLLIAGLLAFSSTAHAGIALNNLTTTQRGAISAPAAGSAVWNTTTTALNWYDGSGWAGLTVAAGKSPTISNTLTLAGTDATVMTFPATSQTIPGLGQANIWTANGALSSGAGPAATFNGTWITGGSATTTKPYFLIETTDATSTGWSTSGTGFGVNAASGFTGNLIDAQLAGVSSFKVSSGGVVTCANFVSGGQSTVGDGAGNILTRFGGSTAHAVQIGFSGILGWGANAANAEEPDLVLSRNAAAVLRFGFADAASPVAQTVTVQGVVAGTTNTAGAAFTIAGSKGTGTGVGGSILFQTAPAGSTGSSQNALATVLTLASTGQALLSANGALSTPILTATGTWITGGSATTTKPYVLIEPSGTATTNWSTAGTGIGVNATSGFTGNLLDLQIAAVRVLSCTEATASAGTTGAVLTASGNLLRLVAGSAIDLLGGGTVRLYSSGGGLSVRFDTSTQGKLIVTDNSAATFPLLQCGGATSSFPAIGRSGTSLVLQLADGTLQTPFTSVAAGSFQHGLIDVDTNAAIVAQTIRSQGALTGGTSNQAGKDFTFIASPGKGTGAGGQFLFQTAPAGSTGTTVNSVATGLTITAPVVNMQPGVVIGNQALATTATDGFLWIAGGSGAPSGVPASFTGRYPLYWDHTNKQLYIYDAAWLQPKTPAAAAIVSWQ